MQGRLLQKRKVDFIDIAHDVKKKGYENRISHLGPDPAEYRSSTAGRGPLEEGWIEVCNGMTPEALMQHAQPVMCAYKLAVIDVDYFGIQKRVRRVLVLCESWQVEKLVQKQALRTEFYKAHRKMFCWMDEW